MADHALSNEENLTHECDSNQNGFYQEENSIECPTDYGAEHQKQAVQNQHPIGRILRQNAVDTNRTVEHHIVDRRQSTVDDVDGHLMGKNIIGMANTTYMAGTQFNQGSTQLGITGNMVDRQKRTVEDDSPSPLVTTQNTGIQSTSSGITGNMVDRQKRTVEDDSPSPMVTTQNTGIQSTSSGITGNMVDRQKRTVEDDSPSPFVSGSTRLEERFDEACNIGRKQRMNSQPEAEKWKIHLYVHTECQETIIQYLPTSKLFRWNKSVVLGRREGADIFINDDHASRDHVELAGQILPDGQVSFMARNTSRKGYYLNGEQITATDRWIALKRNDNIKIAGLMCSVDIVSGTDMDNFVIEFKLPGIYYNPVVTIPTPVYQVPLSPNGQPGYYNQYPVPGFPFHPNRLEKVRTPQPYLSPTNGVPGSMYPYSLLGGMHPGQLMGPYLTGPNSQAVTGDMVESRFQPYQGREGYIKLDNLRHLALKAVDEWKELGRALGLKNWQITIIDRDNPKIAEKSYQMLITWVYCMPEEATLEKLKKALEDITVGRGDLVKDYCTVDTNGGGNDSASTSTGNNGSASE